MSVKSVHTFFNVLKNSYLCFFGACALLVVSVLIMRVPDKKYLETKTELALRAIGDGLLRLHNDFNTPVPPIHQNDSRTLQLGFVSAIGIHPDSLVTLTLKHLNEKIAQKYTVGVRDTHVDEIVYLFEVDHSNGHNISCLGRVLPIANYVIEVQINEDKWASVLQANTPALTTASIALLLLFFGGAFFMKKKPLQHNANEVVWNGLQLDLDLNTIKTNHVNIQLTTKETQILAMLFRHTGNLVSRESFLQQIWLKDGVVTNRSLDMYISRLRKKMKVFSNVQIVNQHGKGYYVKGIDAL